MSINQRFCISISRRRFAQGLAFAISWMVLGCRAALASIDRRHFATVDFQAVWAQLIQNLPIETSQQLTLVIPELAENGAVVPLNVSSQLNDLTQLLILVEKNPTPLIATFELSASVAVNIHARIKLAESSHVHVLARRGDGWLHTQQWVKVMVGGCGTG